MKAIIVGNKAKERILKRVFEENKACQIFRKTIISYPMIRTHRQIEPWRKTKWLCMYDFGATLQTLSKLAI